MLDTIKRFALKVISKLRLRANRRGFVLIVVVALIPVVLLGVRYVVEHAQITTAKPYIKNDDYASVTNKCAELAALAVAQQWNPGLTFSQQKTSMLRIADQAYNKTEKYSPSAAGQAIAGIDVQKISITKKDKLYDVSKISVKPDTSLANPSDDSIQYTTTNTTFYRYNFSASDQNQYVGLYQLINIVADQRNDIFSNDDICSDAVATDDANGGTRNFYVVANSKYGTALSTAASSLSCTCTQGNQVKTANYTTRTNALDSRVQISINNDKIKVITDNKDISHAVPAQCNVDIVLAIPTNGAASNINNRDAASDYAETPHYQTSTTLTSSAAQSSPIMQMASAYRKFLQENFFYTKGVNVGLIPYSGKISLPANRSAWSAACPKFINTDYINNQTTHQAYTRGVYLYGTSGVSGSTLSQDSYQWGDIVYGFPIMGRFGAGTQNLKDSGGNTAYYGDLLSISQPNSTSTYFARMNANPCYAGYANFLNMTCERACTSYLPNPYSIAELTADVSKIYELLGALYPIYDLDNVSNFLFLPITWANNLFQSWTNDPVASASSEQLSRQSKATSNRKKAVILMVNKPDWFEPGELTYLGFNNDLSEFTMMESDKIDFGINYSDTSKTFLDGSRYDNSMQGSKKILKFTNLSGNIDSTGTGTCTARLSFPQKGLIKLVVAAGTGKMDINFLDKVPGIRNWSGICYGHGKYAAVTAAIEVILSSDFNTWAKLSDNTENSGWPCICSGLAEYGTLTSTGNFYTAQTDFTKGITIKASLGSSGWYGLCHDGAQYIALNSSGAVHGSTDGTNWLSIGTIDPAYTWKSICYGGGQYLAISSTGKIASSMDSKNWIPLGDIGAIVSSGWIGICYGNGAYAALNDNGIVAISVNGGISWVQLTSFNHLKSTDWNSICYDGTGFCVLNDSNAAGFASYPANNGRFKFLNVTDDTVEKIIDEQEEIYVEPSQISSIDSNGNYYIDFNITNIRLLSAEITNRPYEKITPTCSLSGSTNCLGSSGDAYVTTSHKCPIKLMAKCQAPTITFETAGTIKTDSVTNTMTATFGANDFDSIDDLSASSRDFLAGDTFGPTTSLKKVKVICNNAMVSNMYLSGQILRKYTNIIFTQNSKKAPVPNHDPAVNVFQLNNITENSNEYDVYTVSQIDLLCAFMGVKKGQLLLSQYRGRAHPLIISLWNGSAADDATSITWTSNATEIYNKSTNGDTFVKTNEFISPGKNTYVKITRPDCPPDFTDSSDSRLVVHEILCKNLDTVIYDPTITSLTDIKLINNRALAFLDISGEKWVCFNGGGKLSIIVTALPVSGTITCTDKSGTDRESSISSTTGQEEKISPTTHDYVDLGNGTYKIKLKLNNIQIFNASQNTFYNISPKPRALSNARRIDFSQTPPTKDANIFLDGVNGSYNIARGFYSINESLCKPNVAPLMYPGDITSVIESYSPFIIHLLGPSTLSESLTSGNCYVPGVFRKFIKLARKSNGESISFKPYSTSYNNATDMISVDFSLPINAYLYYGARGSSTFSYQWQADTSGNVTTFDPTVAVGKVTRDAISKLKSDHGANLRIYVIKFRKQQQYKSYPFHNSTQTLINHDYSIANSCATSTSQPYLYDVSTPAELDNALKAIADDIKSFASYEEAKNL